MAPPELKEKREDFRRYLEGTGATEKITEALLKLYHEGDKPEDAVAFIRKQLGDDCPAEKINALEEQIKGLERDKKIITMEREVAQGQVKRSPSTEIKLLTQGFDKLLEEDDEDEDRSLLKKYLTEELFEKLQTLKTPLGGSLYDQIQSGLANFEQEIGIFASDPKAYDVFDELFSPVLEDLHYVEADCSHPSMGLGDSNEIENLDPEKLFINSITITINRSLKDYAFMPLISLDKIQLVEEQITDILSKIEDEELKGKYHKLIDIDDEQLKQWTEDRTIFPPPEDENLKAAQTYRMWSKSRGLFINEKNDFRVWVNEEEQLKMIVFEESGNLKAAYEKLCKGINFFGSLEFEEHPRWGFLAHNLKNIGTTMRISAQMKLPKLSLRENASKLSTLCDGHCIIAHRNDNYGSYEMYNLMKLGMNEIALVKKFQDGIKDFITSEKCLYLS